MKSMQWLISLLRSVFALTRCPERRAPRSVSPGTKVPSTAGVWKPRTSPYTFQGLGDKALQIMTEIRDTFGVKIVTEAVEESHVDLIEKYGDVIQIGARNMQNFSLLKRAGRSKVPVLLKRGMA